MNIQSKTLVAALYLLAASVVAAADETDSETPQTPADAAGKSAEQAAKNLTYVSSALGSFQKGLNDIAAVRASHILSVRKLAYAGQQVSINEVAVLQKTDGADIAKLYEALCDYGDKAAQASAQAAAAETAAKAEIASSYTPLKISTEKLDSAAKALAALSKPQTDAERARFLAQFLKDTRAETKRLLETSGEAKKKADADLQDKAGKAAAMAPIQLKKD